MRLRSIPNLLFILIILRHSEATAEASSCFNLFGPDYWRQTWFGDQTKKPKPLGESPRIIELGSTENIVARSGRQMAPVGPPAVYSPANQLTHRTVRLESAEHALDMLFIGYQRLAKETGSEALSVVLDNLSQREEMRMKTLAVMAFLGHRVLANFEGSTPLAKFARRVVQRLATQRQNIFLSGVDDLKDFVDMMPGRPDLKIALKKTIDEHWNNLRTHFPEGRPLDVEINHRFQTLDGVTIVVSGVVDIFLRYNSRDEFIIVDSRVDRIGVIVDIIPPSGSKLLEQDRLDAIAQIFTP